MIVEQTAQKIRILLLDIAAKACFELEHPTGLHMTCLSLIRKNAEDALGLIGNPFGGVHDVTDLYEGLKEGDIVELKVPCLGNSPGTKGIVVHDYNGDEVEWDGCTVIFANGSYDGFSREDQDRWLTKTGHSDTFSYRFRNVMQLSRDFDSGYFDEYFR